MIWLTKIKDLWSKGKYYISFALVGLAAVFLIFVLRKKDLGLKMIEKIKEKHSKELDIINKTHKEEVEKKEIEVDKYNKIIKKIEKSHAVKNKELNANYKKQVDKILRKYDKDPEGLSKKLSEEFGIKYTVRKKKK